jgi:hypothetical protein
MKTIGMILMAVSAIALILAALMGVDIIKTAIWNVSGTGFLLLSIACSVHAVAIHILKPLDKT